jgi:hypothetical protein
LLNVPYIATKAYYIVALASLCHFIKIAFNGVFAPIKIGFVVIEVVQYTNSQVEVDIFCVEGGEEECGHFFELKVKS